MQRVLKHYSNFPENTFHKSPTAQPPCTSSTVSFTLRRQCRAAEERLRRSRTVVSRCGESFSGEIYHLRHAKSSELQPFWFLKALQLFDLLLAMDGALGNALQTWKSVSAFVLENICCNVLHLFGGCLLNNFSRLLSQGPGKIGWTQVDVKDMAFSLRRSMPMAVQQILTSKDWRGGALVQLEDSTSSATASDIVLNYSWLRPFVEKFRDRVPSTFFIADSFIALDKLYMGALPVPLETGDCKTLLACEEAKRVKNLIGSLRALWRSSASADG